MREILTIIAACLVVALTAALAVPPFVDWDARREAIEARLSAGFDGTVRIEGPTALRLLPAPRLTFGAMSASRPGLEATGKAVRLELSPTALMRGRFVFTEAALEQARISVAPDRFEGDAVDAGRIGVERLVLSDARIEVAGAAPIIVDHVEMSAVADSLVGPFRGSGIVRGARLATFSFSTGPVADGKLRGKIALDARATHVETEGDLSIGGGALAFAGKASAAGSSGADGPRWRASFAVLANGREAHAENLDVRLGDDDSGLSASGEAKISGDGLDARLTARNLDLDRLRRAFPDWRPSLADTFGDMRAKVALAADSATLGGETVAAPGIRLELAPGAEPRVTLDAEPPGRSRLHYEGALAFAPEVRLAGALRFSSRDPAAFGAWLAPAAPELARILAASPFERVEADATIDVRGAAFEARVSEARLDRSTFSGNVRFQPPRDGLRARIDANVRSPALDIDGLPEMPRLNVGDLDFLLDLDAQAVRVARVGAAAAAAGRIRMRLARYGAGLTLENLAVDNLGGATLTGGGRLDRSGGRLDMRLDAERLGDLARLAARIAPSAASAALVARAGALSPAHVTFAIAAQEGALSQMDVSGEAGGTKIDARLKPAAGGDIGFSLKASAAESTRLASQIGLAALPLKGMGPGLIEAEGAGPADKPMRMKGQATLAGARAEFDGETTLALDRFALDGRALLSSADATPLIQMFGFGAGDLARRIPVDVAAHIQASPGRVALDDISGSAAGVRLQGRLARDGDEAVVGALNFDTLSAPFLAALALGPPQPAAAGAIWSQIRFAPSLFDPPAANVTISARQIDLGVVRAQDAQADVALAPGRVVARNIRLRLGEGEFAGEVSLLREEAAALLKANVAMTNVRLQAQPFSTRATGTIAVAGAGASVAELVGSLAGGGRLKFEEIRIARADPSGVADAAAAFDRDEANVGREGVMQSLARGFDRGDQAPGLLTIDVGVAAGRATTSPVTTDIGGARARIDGGLDLRTMRLEIHESLQSQASKDWTGPPPSVDLVWRGAPSALAREIRADGLVAALAERAIARETARNAALEADIRERGYFNRRLKSDRRLEAERRAATEARRKAEAAARVEAARLEQERLERERGEPARLDRDPRIMAPSTDDGPASAPKPAPRAPSAFAPAPRGAPPDPSTAGRY